MWLVKGAVRQELEVPRRHDSASFHAVFQSLHLISVSTSCELVVVPGWHNRTVVHAAVMISNVH